ncbi:MAG: 50S ribosome-binding GTPase [bacterium]|nr:50S ribosome-binding GTPase [bacterium]
MKTHKFVAPTMKEAIARIKEELGEDALIIRSERVKVGGPMNRIRPEMIEVTAARAEEVKDEAQVGPEFAETLDRTMSRTSAQSRPAVPDFQLGQISDEVRRLRDDLADLGKLLKSSQMDKMPRELAAAWQRLGESGVNDQWAADLAQDALLRLDPNELVSAPVVENYLISRIARAVRPAPQMTARPNRSYVLVAVGSPGAGKTTLLQKLASDPAAFGKRRIGLISLDTHRMAAVEQLRAFARIAGLPLEVVFRPDQIAAAVQKLGRNEIILVDTPGCAPDDGEKLRGLSEFLNALNADEIHLVLNSTTRDDEMIHAGRRYREIGLTHLSFTHTDESLRHGYLLNIARSAERPIAWLSRGQGFVGCIERFTPEHLRRWIAMEHAVDVAAPALTEIKRTETVR